jgi:uncharacterized protein (TIGR00251 family)
VLWQDAVEGDGGNCILALETTPGAKYAKFPDGFNEWRGRIGIAVRAEPQDGKANQEAIVLIANFFDISKSKISILNGLTDRRKRAKIYGVSFNEAVNLLAAAI